jgi:universal stress protein A
MVAAGATRASRIEDTTMSGYRHILLGLDLSAESRQVVDRAVALRDAFGSALSVIHVIEPLSFAYGGDIPMDFSGIQEEIHKQARAHLDALCGPLNIPASGRHLVVGRPETEIHHVAEEIGADLILIGSHGRHGLQLLMGSTANGVLHGAKCDVLAVRVQDAAR